MLWLSLNLLQGDLLEKVHGGRPAQKQAWGARLRGGGNGFRAADMLRLGSAWDEEVNTGTAFAHQLLPTCSNPVLSSAVSLAVNCILSYTV